MIFTQAKEEARFWFPFELDTDSVQLDCLVDGERARSLARSKMLISAILKEFVFLRSSAVLKLARTR